MSMRPGVAFVFPGNTSRDIQAQMALVAERFGARIGFVSFSGRGPLHAAAEAMGGWAVSLREERVGRLSPLNPRLVRHVRRLLHRHGVRYLVCHTQTANILGTWLRSEAKVTSMRHHADYVDRGTDWKPKVGDRWVNTFADRQIAISEAVRRQLVEVEGVSPTRIHRMNLGFDWDAFPEPDASGVEEIRAAYPERRLVLSVGRFIPCKRHELLLTAFEKAARRVPEATLLLAGHGPLEDRVRDLAQASSADVRLIGHVSNIQDYYEACDLVVHPSESEASCNTLKEVILYRVPFLACRGVGDIEDYCDRGEYLVHKSVSPEALGSRIADLMERPREASIPPSSLVDGVKDRFDVQRQLPYFEAWFGAD